MNRSKARELAFKLIYEKEIQKEARRRNARDVYCISRNSR
jgi:transcription termination factor NusB